MGFWSVYPDPAKNHPLLEDRSGGTRLVFSWRLPDVCSFPESIMWITRQDRVVQQYQPCLRKLGKPAPAVPVNAGCRSAVRQSCPHDQEAAETLPEPVAVEITYPLPSPWLDCAMCWVRVFLPSPTLVAKAINWMEPYGANCGEFCFPPPTLDARPMCFMEP